MDATTHHNCRIVAQAKAAELRAKASWIAQDLHKALVDIDIVPPDPKNCLAARTLRMPAHTVAVLESLLVYPGLVEEIDQILTGAEVVTHKLARYATRVAIQKAYHGLRREAGKEKGWPDYPAWAAQSKHARELREANLL